MVVKLSPSPPAPPHSGAQAVPQGEGNFPEPNAPTSPLPAGEGRVDMAAANPTWSEGRLTLTSDAVWAALHEVMDPEIPVLSLVDLGVVREVTVSGDVVTVTMTPTFSGCPALVEMQRLIEVRLLALGAASVAVNTVLAPSWSSDWISDEGRRKLKAFGLAPPPVHGGDVQIMLFDVVRCPRCNSDDVLVRNTFGSTLCRAIYYCNRCQDAFEQFKPL